MVVSIYKVADFSDKIMRSFFISRLFLANARACDGAAHKRRGRRRGPGWYPAKMCKGNILECRARVNHTKLIRTPHPRRASARPPGQGAPVEGQRR